MAYANSQIEQYRKNRVTSASPIELVIMLYDGAIQAMNAGRQAIIDQDFEKQNRQLQKAQRIVAELMSTLNMERGGEVAQNLFSLYTFVHNRLVEANVKDDPAIVDEALPIMKQLRESWAELETARREGRMNAEVALAAA